MSLAKACKNCAAWNAFRSTECEGMGICRRHAPRPFVVTRLTDEHVPPEDMRTQWPITLAIGFCMEWVEQE